MLEKLFYNIGFCTVFTLAGLGLIIILIVLMSAFIGVKKENKST